MFLIDYRVVTQETPLLSRVTWKKQWIAAVLVFLH
jgi:hypothetical protein